MDKTFHTVQKYEAAYIKTLRVLPSRPREVLLFSRRLTGAFHRIIRHINILRRNTSQQDSRFFPGLEEYLSDVTRIHERVLKWIFFDAAFNWPSDDQSLLSGTGRFGRQRVSARQLKRARQEIFDGAETVWQELQTRASTSSWPDPRHREIFLKKKKLEELPANTGHWRIHYRELNRITRTYVRSVLADARYDLNGKFRTVLTRHTAMQGTSSLNGAGPEGRGPALQRLNDWVRGYYPLSSGQTQRYQRITDDLSGWLARCRKRRIVKNSILTIIVIVLCSGTIRFLRHSRIDDDLWRLMTYHVHMFFKFDFRSVSGNIKKEYFQKQIKALDPDASLALIRSSLNTFREREFETDTDRTLYFCRHILKPFLLLLSSWDTDTPIKNDVLAAAYDLNTHVGQHLEAIIGLFEDKTIREKALRRHLLEMRRAIVRTGVFPFAFIALEDGVPYIFLFTETIITTYCTSDYALEQMHIDKDRFSKSAFWPTTAFLVEGEDYPFTDRAGYFEGEFAVVFRRLTSEVQWTVDHEIGHVIDRMRFLYEQRPFPENVELHAMLFPMIWNDDRKKYITQRLVPEALRADAYDRYVQAAKGILNGLNLYLAEQNSSLKQIPLISNRFELDRIRRIADLARQTDTQTIKKAAYRLYADEDQYLATADPGLYITHSADFHEVIYGTGHSISYQGFILRGRGLVGPRNGPRFIFDGAGENISGAGFNLWSFLRNVFSLIFYHRDNIPQATTAEAITAPMIVFVLFNACVFLIHWAGASYRKRKFYGRPMPEIITRIYDLNPWCRGYDRGDEQRERSLLQRIFQADGRLDPQLKRDIAAFKSVATDRERTVFDLCLCLAPFNPARSRILNKAHDLLFFLPFLGPYLGRAAWIWPVQKIFHLREQYNRDIERLLTRCPAATAPESLVEQYNALLQRYRASETTHDKPLTRLESLSLLKAQGEIYLKEFSPVAHMNINFLTDKLAENREQSIEFDRLEEYSPGDDIRHIDWKSTARSTTAAPLVRRFSRPYGARIALWLDMRSLHDEQSRRRWAKDFAHSMKIFHLYRSETILERLVIIGPTGEWHEYPVQLTADRDLARLTGRLFELITEKYLEIAARHEPLDLDGLSFYTPEENERVLLQLALSDFSQKSEPDIRLRPLEEKKMNIFVVGGKMSEKDILETLAGDENRVYYW